uniref:olfactory receptor 1L3-like n=1 Tax=Panthera onca TaxID=9690 RepID=UPI002955DF35|nr:olfactory receptor 1L3-like [Panthera onca]
MGMSNLTRLSEFILIGLSSHPEDQKPLFALFLIMYLVTITGNLLIILAIRSDPKLQNPMYFFLSILSFADICYTTVVVPKMLVNFLSETKTISYAESYICIIISYLRILIAVFNIPSASGKCKAFSTCSSHLTVVTLFYGSISYEYFHPLSRYTVKDRVATIIYTVLTSMLNPFIYTLRNKDMKRGLEKLISRIKAQMDMLSTTQANKIHGS